MESAPMPSPLDHATQALDDAIAASRQTRRRKLLRAARNQRIRTGVVFGLTACMALIALAALVTGDREASIIIGLMTCWTFALALFAWKIGRKNALQSLREMDRSI
jgi:hypothetical protein